MHAKRVARACKVELWSAVAATFAYGFLETAGFPRRAR
jgi:hypothetical protein